MLQAAHIGAGNAANVLVVLALSRDAEPALLLRDAARRTWMQSIRSRAHFVLGGSSELSAGVRQEQARHRDILFVDAPDDYASLSLKVQLGFRAAIALHPTLTHLLKTDDDSWVTAPRALGPSSASVRKQAVPLGSGCSGGLRTRTTLGMPSERTRTASGRHLSTSSTACAWTRRCRV